MLGTGPGDVHEYLHSSSGASACIKVFQRSFYFK